MGMRQALLADEGWVTTASRPPLKVAYRRLIPAVGRLRLRRLVGLPVVVPLGLALVAVGLVYGFMFTEPRPPTLGYSLAAVRAGQESVPRAFLTKVPETISTEKVTRKRKTQFLRLVLPLVLHANELIKRDRDRLIALITVTQAGRRPTLRDRAWLSRVAETYGTEDGDWAALKRRIDVLPPSLALAQAAVESGWGSSRFARQGNALFGIWTWNDKAGLVPKQRDAGARYSVRRYDRLLDSVRGYLHTLNTHPAYRELRRMRATMRVDGTPLDSRRLVSGLRRYAEKTNYVALIAGVIRRNRLRQLDQAVLARRTPFTVFSRQEKTR